MQQMTEEQRRELEEKIKNMSPEELKEFQKQQCIFCQIIAGKIPSKKIYEDKNCLAVMDINPASLGHVLLLPKEHYAIMPQIPTKEIGHLFMVAKSISQIMLKKLKVEGTNIFVANGPAAGQRTQHFMVHIIPRKDGDEILDIPEQIIAVEMREKIAEVIEKKMNQLMGIKKETQKKLPEPKVEEKEEPEEEKKEQENTAEEIKEPKKEKTSKKSPSKKAVTPKKYSKKTEKEEGASLDDIAKLFK